MSIAERVPMRSVLLGILVVGLGLAGCASEPLRALTTQLRACELLTDGRIGSRTLEAIYAPTACYEQCLAEASCEELEDALCRTSVSLLVRCDEACAFRCDDGGLIGPERECDGSPQCMGGEDEESCNFPLTCRSGVRVAGARCDGAWNCSDGSDEEGCTVDRCDGGRWLGAWERCDGFQNCVDGTDERGCPTHLCDDGRTVTYRPDSGSPLCNGWTQCGDGSDERSCAQLDFACGG